MKGLRLYLIAGGAILILYIIAQLNRPKAVDWTETLSNKDKTPFGTYILYNRLQDLFPKAQVVAYRAPVYNVIVDDSVKNSSYIIICGGIDLSKADYQKLTDYIKQGNDVFIAAEDFGATLEKNLGVTTQIHFKLNYNPTPVHFLSPHLNPKTYYTVDKGSTNLFFGKFDTLKAVALAENDEHKVNFIKFKFGKGSLFLMSNPKLFTNYSLLKPNGAAFAQTTLSFVKNTPRLLWDVYYTQGDEGQNSPMRVFLSNKYLQWAYYIAVASLLIFVLYEIKRRQRIIPVIKPLANSTLDFVNVVGQLYYEKHNNADIAHKKITYFLSDLRDAYQLKTNQLDEEFIKNFAAKFGFDMTYVRSLISYLQFMGAENRVSDRDLIELNKLIEQFYTQAR